MTAAGSPSLLPKTSGASTNTFFGHWLGRNDLTRGMSTRGIVKVDTGKR
jgi:hypothetical protein